MGCPNLIIFSWYDLHCINAKVPSKMPSSLSYNDSIYLCDIRYLYSSTLDLEKRPLLLCLLLVRELYILPMVEMLIIFQKLLLHKTLLSSPHRWWTSMILSTDLQIPLHFQSKEATQMLPAWAFHSQSAEMNYITNSISKIHLRQFQVVLII